MRLQSLYPGNNATHIANQQNIVVSSWTALQERSAHRREVLHASCDLHRFLAKVSKKEELLEKLKKLIFYIKYVLFYRLET